MALRTQEKTRCVYPSRGFPCAPEPCAMETAVRTGLCGVQHLFTSGDQLVVTKKDFTRAVHVSQPLDLPGISEHRRPQAVLLGEVWLRGSEGLLLLAPYFQPSYSTWPYISNGQC